MELIGDWKALIPVVSKSPNVDPQFARSPIFVVTERSTILAAYAPGMDLGGFIGGSLEDLSTRFRHRDIRAVPRSEMDDWIKDSISMNHYFDQMAAIRSNAGYEPIEGPALLDGLTRLSSRFLPSSFGVWLKIEGMGLVGPKGEARAHEVLLVYRSGKLYSYIDTSKIDETRGTDAKGSIGERHRILSGRYLIPLQTMIFTRELWDKVQESPRPFGVLFKAAMRKQVELYPRRPLVLFYLGIKALFRR